jgi:hypothetical protein
MRFATSSTNDQRSLVRVAPRVFLIRDGKLLDRHRQGEQRQEHASGLPARTPKAPAERA